MISAKTISRTQEELDKNPCLKVSSMCRGYTTKRVTCDRADESEKAD